MTQKDIPHIVVVVEGGVVQHVFADQPVAVLIKDFDNIKESGTFDVTAFHGPPVYTDRDEFLAAIREGVDTASTQLVNDRLPLPPTVPGP